MDKAAQIVGYAVMISAGIACTATFAYVALEMALKLFQLNKLILIAYQQHLKDRYPKVRP